MSVRVILDGRESTFEALSGRLFSAWPFTPGTVNCPLRCAAGSHPGDRELAACWCGQCFAALMERHGGVVWNVVRQFASARIEFAELRQEALLALHERRARFATAESFRAVAALVIYDRLCKRARDANALARGGTGNYVQRVPRAVNVSLCAEVPGHELAVGDTLAATHPGTDPFRVAAGREGLRNARERLTAAQRKALTALVVVGGTPSAPNTLQRAKRVLREEVAA